MSRADDTTPVAEYDTLHVNRGWMVIFAIVWVVVVVWAMDAFDAELQLAADTDLIGYYVVGLIASGFLAPILATSRRSWRILSDGLDIIERPLIPPLGLYRQRLIPFAKIRRVRKGELLNGTPIIEIEARSGARFRLTPRTVGMNRDVHQDIAGFEATIAALRQAIERVSVPLPPGSELRTLGSGVTGLVILGGSTALLAGAAVLGIWLSSTGEPAGAQLAAVVAPFTLIAGFLFLRRYRMWRAGDAGI